MKLLKKIIIPLCIATIGVPLHAQDPLVDSYKMLQTLQNKQNEKITELSMFIKLQQQKKELSMQLGKATDKQKPALQKKLQEINQQLADLSISINKQQTKLATSKEAKQVTKIKKELIQNVTKK